MEQPPVIPTVQANLSDSKAHDVSPGFLTTASRRGLIISTRTGRESPATRPGAPLERLHFAQCVLRRRLRPSSPTGTAWLDRLCLCFHPRCSPTRRLVWRRLRRPAFPALSHATMECPRGHGPRSRKARRQLCPSESSAPRSMTRAMSDLVLESALTCPTCGRVEVATMPTDACRFSYECPSCHAILRRKPGDCGVFCSDGSVRCPPKQALTSTDMPAMPLVGVFALGRESLSPRALRPV